MAKEKEYEKIFKKTIKIRKRFFLKNRSGIDHFLPMLIHKKLMMLIDADTGIYQLIGTSLFKSPQLVNRLVCCETTLR